MRQHRHPNRVMTAEELEQFKQDFSSGLQFGFRAVQLFKSAFARLVRDDRSAAEEQAEQEKS